MAVVTTVLAPLLLRPLLSRCTVEECPPAKK
jgi:hypothetical protein